MVLQTRQCRECKEIKNIDEFYKREYGWRYYCKKCNTIRFKEYRKNHGRIPLEIHSKQRRINAFKRIEEIKNNGKKICKKCLKEKNLKEFRFVFSKQRKIGYFNGKCKECVKPIHLDWIKKNKWKVYVSARRMKLKRQQRVIPWANNKKIQLYYWMAHKLTDIIGEKYVVDHIVPLHGETVSGLHHENNLQVMSMKNNLIKSNKFKNALYTF